jgi:hypothetical protein
MPGNNGRNTYLTRSAMLTNLYVHTLVIQYILHKSIKHSELATIETFKFNRSESWTSRVDRKQHFLNEFTL